MEEKNPKAKLINATIREPFYFSTYEYECIKCGKHFTRATYNSRISPYCGECSRERDRINNNIRRQAQKFVHTIMELNSIKDEITELTETFYIEPDVFRILDEHISKLKEYNENLYKNMED